MSKIMLINVTHTEETRVAIVSDGTLEAFQIEGLSRSHQKGNIYKGVLHRVHPALEAAFVDIGGPRHGFLPMDEVCFRNLPGAEQKRASARNGRRKRRIQDIFKPGTEILVQIVKEAFGNKPPTLTTFYSLAGRYLVLTPGSAEAGISRKIEGEHRERLKSLVSKLKPPEGCGIIVRTAAGFDQDVAELERDLAYLTQLWESIQEIARNKTAPCLVYREHDLVIRNIRDYFTPDIEEITLDNEEAYKRAKAFMAQVTPGYENRVRLWDGKETIFSRFNLENQIESIFKRKVELPSGASIVIDPTEALTVIDVNSGGAVRGANQEQTAFRTNREAACEIARQLRLRDVGGLVVIDFIDMREPQHIQEIERTLREAMRPDKARYDIGHISRFGLLEVSRQRLRPAAAASSYTTCTMCEGYGLVRTTESGALVALRKIQNLVARGDLAALKVTLPSAAALYLMNQKRRDLVALEEAYTTKIVISASQDLMPHQSLFDPVPKGSGDTIEVAPGAVAGVEEAGPGAEAEEGAASRKAGRRRRRRRRGRARAEEKLAAGAPREASAAQSPVPQQQESPPPQPAETPASAQAQAPPSKEEPQPAKKRRSKSAVRKAKTEGESESGATAQDAPPKRKRGGRRRKSSKAKGQAAADTAAPAADAS